MEILEIPNSASIPCQPDTLDFLRLRLRKRTQQDVSIAAAMLWCFCWDKFVRKDLSSGMALPDLLEKTCPQAWLCLDAGSRTEWCWIGSTWCKNLRAAEICGSCFYLGVFHDACLGTSTKAGFICQICILARHWSFHNGHILSLLRITCTLSLHWWKSRKTCQDTFWHCEVSVTWFWYFDRSCPLLCWFLYLEWWWPCRGQWCSWAQEVWCLEKSTCQCHGHAQCQHEKW